MLWEILGQNYSSTLTHRAALATVSALVLEIILGKLWINYATRTSVKEISEKGDSKELDTKTRHKTGTPSMGGISIVVSAVLAMVIFSDVTSGSVYSSLILILFFFTVGLLDDLSKLRKRGGLTPFQKLVPLLLGSAIASTLLYVWLLQTDPRNASVVTIPFFGDIDIGFLWPAFTMMVVTAMANAVNITDGLDGLAAGCYGIAIFAAGVVGYIVARVDFSRYLQITNIVGAYEIPLVCGALGGATIGFLWYNCNPAQMFMGDCGSLPLGGMLGFAACTVKKEFLLVLFAAPILIELLSSFLQIAAFKMTGRRIFRIAPIHHIWQLQGVPEQKITVRFWLCAIAVSILALVLLRIA